METSVEIYNNERSPDTYNIDLEGLERSWWEISTVSASLYPGDSCRSTVSINPPRDSSSVAGTYAFRVIVRSQSSVGTPKGRSGYLTLEPFHSFSAELRPVSSNRRVNSFALKIRNDGNISLPIKLSGRAPQDSLLFRFEPESPTIGPGESVEVGLTVAPKRRPLLGTPRARDFLVKTVAPLPGAVPDLTLDSATVHPHVPVWVFWLLLLVVATVAVAAGVTVIAESYR